MTRSIVVSQLGARMHYAVPRILHRAGMLTHFYTDICATKGWPRLLGRLPRSVLNNGLRRLAGRVPADIPADRMTCFNGIGLLYTLHRMRARSPSEETAAMLATARAFSRRVVRRGFGDADGFYGIAGECLEQMQAARAAGLWTAVEQIIAPRGIVERLIQEEAARFPDWERPGPPDRHAEAFGAREKAEWEAADLIVCPSEFVRQTVIESGGPAGRCVLVPYGVDARFQLPERRRIGGPLRVLTIGAVGLRKGSPYVAEAARQLAGHAVFRMVGPCNLPEQARSRLGDLVEITGPVPRAEILDHYAWADVFLLPSICEGSATVIYEAMAAGLPVITTANSGSVVRDGLDGFVVPIRDAAAIAEALAFLHGHRGRLADMSRQAQARARDFDLAGYGRRLRQALAQPGEHRPALAVR
ncbi:glycosyltransferase family 4 protein [Inquilinus sp. Marseille-Q2685]|uniref:glycosyltransferase family 4 protein n=1 Tax=Inquilinus sp. Marseille-Q2685 TaxID=2866581 RepID=UPI001CE4A3CF|nr:glycosyltransferase family 4 protein [Inquilinus sp. Marseille-Q2685]